MTRVTVYRGYDPIQAQIVADLLAQDGIAAIVQGGHASTIFGAGQSFLEVRVLAPGERAERARELIAAFSAAGGMAARAEAGEDAGRAGGEDAGDEAGREAGGADEGAAPSMATPRISPEAHAPRRRPPLMAVGIAAIIPGGGHFYARRVWVGFAVAAGQVGAVVTMVGRDAVAASGAALAALCIFAFDAAFGALGAGGYNRGARPGVAAQLGTAVVALGIIATVAALAAPHLARWRPRRVATEAKDSPWGTGSELRDRALAPEELPFPLHLDLDGRRPAPR